MGAWAKKGEDINDGDLITVLNEGKEDDSGDFGPRQVFLCQMTSGEEKNVAFNQTSLNNLIDAFGEDSASWVGKRVKAWLVRQNVAGKFQQVLYVSSPDADFTDDGFILLPPGTAKKSKKKDDEIPVIEDEK